MRPGRFRPNSFEKVYGNIKNFKKVRDKKYGDSRLSIYKLIGEPNE